MPADVACPIYACAAQKKRLAACGSCGRLPCDCRETTRDPSMTNAEFAESIRQRMTALKRVWP